MLFAVFVVGCSWQFAGDRRSAWQMWVTCVAYMGFCDKMLRRPTLCGPMPLRRQGENSPPGSRQFASHIGESQFTPTSPYTASDHDHYGNRPIRLAPASISALCEQTPPPAFSPAKGSCNSPASGMWVVAHTEGISLAGEAFLPHLEAQPATHDTQRHFRFQVNRRNSPLIDKQRQR